MAAYAALVSVMHVIHQLEHHPSPPISINKQQVQSLTRNISFLQDFLEGCNAADELESRIADAAHAAEDAIEGHILDHIHAASVFSSHGQQISSLEIVIEEMDLIMKDVMQIKETSGIQDKLHRLTLTPAGSSRSAATWPHNVAMVGVDEIVVKVVDMLTNRKPDRLTIPITGMGGIGKTALARNIYGNQIVTHHFDVLAWVTIPQEYTIEEILLELVLCLEERRESVDHMSSEDEDEFEDELGEMLYKSLSGRRYLIMIDDLWNVEVWDRLQTLFPNNKNGSRIMITTRLANLASQLCGFYSLEMNFLDENDSWNLLCKYVFGDETCPLELEEIGKLIARNCKGLPLSIVVIGGLMTTMDATREYWEYIAQNLNSVVNLEDEEHCLQILYTSYDQLPVHLKPCFLYMGVFPEDGEIHASDLIKLWVAEGFLKPIGGKSLEEAAGEYLKELVDRNLILLHKRSSTGNIKSCKIHDLLRDLITREADKQKFVGFVRHRNAKDRITQRRICVHECGNYLHEALHTLEYVSLARSLIWDSYGTSLFFFPSTKNLECYLKEFSNRLKPSLLRVFRVLDSRFLSISKEVRHVYFEDSVSKLLNLRYISHPLIDYTFSSSMHHHWNLHTLIARQATAVAPPEIWKMPLLRHVEFYNISLPEPPHDGFVLANLQTLLTIPTWDCCEKVVERIPNVKKLKICQGQLEGWSAYHLNNLGRLHKLESLEFGFATFDIPSHLDLSSKLTLPRSLKKLTLYGTRFRWEDMAAKIGSLPLLQVLKLKWNSFIGPEWETVEGQFCSLKSLLIYRCSLVNWTTDNTHFPCLEHLQLGFLDDLKEVPSAIGDIPTLQSIKLTACSSSSVISAKNILEDQQDNYGNDVLQIQIFQIDDGVQSAYKYAKIRKYSSN